MVRVDRHTAAAIQKEKYRYHWENTRIFKGMEKGRFELAGSTIVLLFQKGRVSLHSHIMNELAGSGEYRVTQGMWIGIGHAGREAE